MMRSVSIPFPSSVSSVPLRVLRAMSPLPPASGLPHLARDYPPSFALAAAASKSSAGL
jgi:hypothetical protein